MNRAENAKKVHKKNLLRGSLIVLAALMLLCSSYLVTVAFLKENTGPVKNTFALTSLVAENNFVIVEKKPTDTNENGIFDDDLMGDATTQQATYLFAPGVTLYKRPYVVITDLKEHAYLFVECTSGLSDGLSTLTWEWDAKDGKSCWKPVDNTDNRLIYVYVGGDRADGILLSGNSYEIDIIKEDSVKVAHDVYDITKPSNNSSFELDFSAYLVQAVGFENAKAAWEASGF